MASNKPSPAPIGPVMPRRQYASTISDADIRTYMHACGKAFREGMSQATRIVWARAKQLVRNGSPHRASQRRYPSGYVYQPGQEHTLRKALIRRVLGRDDRKVTGIVRSRSGYSTFQEYGWQPRTPSGRIVGPRVGGDNAMLMARDQSMPQVMQVIGRRWPDR